jgi:hypothetical protein
MTAMKASITICCIILVQFAGIAQQFEITKVTIDPEEITVHYNLEDTTRNITYTIYMYSSRDNFLSPLVRVSGDQGLQVKPGFNKRIAWKAREDLKADFKGDVELEIRGRVYVPFIHVTDFASRTRRRTAPFFVKWTGGTPQNILKFQLYKGDKLVQDFPNAPNEHQYKLTLPATVRPSKNYYLKISDAKNSEQVVITPTFHVKRRIPLALKLIPAMAAGGLIYLLSGEKSGGEMRTPPDVPANSN